MARCRIKWRRSVCVSGLHQYIRQPWINGFLNKMKLLRIKAHNILTLHIVFLKYFLHDFLPHVFLIYYFSNLALRLTKSQSRRRIFHKVPHSNEFIFTPISAIRNALCEFIGILIELSFYVQRIILEQRRRGLV